MNGIDVSHWQKGMKIENIEADFVIMKATEGNYYIDDTTETFYAAATNSNKLRGLYHFAAGTTSGKNEAEYFVDHIKHHLYDCILVLDWEGNAVQRGVAYAKEFLDTVWELTGVRPFVYMSKSVTYSYNWSSVAEHYPLWVAQYPDYNPIYGYLDKPWTDSRGYGAWNSPAIFQYTSSGYLNGWSSRLDLDKAYITEQEWAKFSQDESHQTPMQQPSKKTVKEVAADVIMGMYGNGAERIEKLRKAGYDPNIVQQEVNKQMEENRIVALAQAVLRGEYGIGLFRRLRLGKDYDAVQKKVNELLK